MGRRPNVNDLKNGEHFMTGSTCLPPKIDGQLRRHVVLEIPRINWLVNKPPNSVCVTVLWWGEEGEGTAFRPLSGNEQKSSRKFVRAVYGIKSGPKQFKEYLNDMKVMLLNVVSESDSSLIGRAKIENLSPLSSTHPISGMYPVFNARNKKVAELKVHLCIWPLQSSVEANCNVPTPDGGLHLGRGAEPLSEDYFGELTPKHSEEGGSSLRIGGMDLPHAEFEEHRAGDVVDSVLDSLSRLRNEMVNSCLKTDIFSTQEFGDALPLKLLDSSHGSSMQPMDLILNSILEDRVGLLDDFPSSSADALNLLKHDDIHELFYQQLPTREVSGLDNTTRFSNVPANQNAVLSRNERSAIRKDGATFSSTKQRAEQKNLSGILLGVKKFIPSSNNQKLSDAPGNGRRFYADYVLSVFVCQPSSRSSSKALVAKLKPYNGRSKDGVVEFHQKAVICKKSKWCGPGEDMCRLPVRLELTQGSSAAKPKLLAAAEFDAEEMLSEVGGDLNESVYLDMKDSALHRVGLLEVDVKLLFKGEDEPRVDVRMQKNSALVAGGRTRTEVKGTTKVDEPEDDDRRFRDVPMYACLMVPHGDVFNDRADNKAPGKVVMDVSLVVRSLWRKDATILWVYNQKQRSRIWFNLIQTCALSLSQSLVDKMRDNFVIVEVWRSGGAPRSSELLGIAKLPISPFYQALHDRESLSKIELSTFPVVAVDGSIAVAPSVSRGSTGSLQVALALGTYPQILSFQDLKMKMFPELYVDPAHRRGSSDTEQGQTMPTELGKQNLEIYLDCMQGLMFEGEGHECYLQFLFPDLREAALLQREKFCLTQHRTSAVSCIGDVRLRESFHHEVHLPNNISLCQLISKAYSDNKLSNGVTFDLLSRNPSLNLADKIIARGTLPLVEFCRAIDGRSSSDVGKQSTEFSIKLFKTAGQKVTSLPPCAVLKLQVIHSTPVQGSRSRGGPSLSESHVLLSLCISRACGLKYAAKVLERRMKFGHEDGLDTFLSATFSILGHRNTKTTDVVPSSFRPEFDSEVEFFCALPWIERSSVAEKSLYFIQIFEDASLEIDVFGRNPDVSAVSSADAIFIGRTTIPLSGFAGRCTGLRGWFPIEAPPTSTCSIESRFPGPSSPDGGRTAAAKTDVVGGLEVFVKFHPQSDLEPILEAGRRWTETSLSGETCEVRMRVGGLKFPTECSSCCWSRLKFAPRCYVTYKFFDKETTFSELHVTSLWNEMIHADIGHVRTFRVPLSPAFAWYLREERLEVQVWLTFGRSEVGLLPQADDDYVGSGYIDLVEAADNFGKQLILRDHCPLFNASSDYMGPASLNYDLQIIPTDENKESKTKHNLEEEVLAEAFHKEGFFPARINIERAYHLCLPSQNGPQAPPNAYVTYESSDTKESFHTRVIRSDHDPAWNHDADLWLKKRPGKETEKNLMLKIWHKTENSTHIPDSTNDKVIGFVSVDLKPLLLKEFQVISGFYNITDYVGSHRGQIKVSVTPLQGILPAPCLLSGPEVEEFKNEGIPSASLKHDIVIRSVTEGLEALTVDLKRKLAEPLDFRSNVDVPTSDHLERPRCASESSDERSGAGGAFDSIRFDGDQTATEHSCHHDDDCFVCFSTNIHSDTSSPIQHEQSAQRTNTPTKNFNELEPSPEDLETLDVRSAEAEPRPRSDTASSFVSSAASSEDDRRDRKALLTLNWLSEHKKKVSERVVAFKSFKAPSVEQAQRIAHIFANKYSATKL